MIFQIKDSKGKSFFYTEYVECIPFENLDSMEEADLVFYLDNEKISKSELRAKYSTDVETDKVKEEPAADIKEEIQETPQFDFPITNRTIICVNTGKYYKNQKEAADEYHCDSANISYCVTTGKAYKGLYFKRVLNK